ncbi:MAG: beta-ketoacyl synthase chain length factor [Acidobacteria bacterium]|nr:beta-ketoacyl synthase chain length factor [Acidobacteriota bacterium]
MTAGDHDTVVTGVGVIAGPHVGVDAVRAAMTEAAPRASAVTRDARFHLAQSSRLALLPVAIDWPALLPPGLARRMSPPSRLAVAAARLARADAGLPATPEGPRTAVVLSTAFGAVESTEQMLDTVRIDGPQAASPFVFAESVANAAAGQVAIDTGARGPNLTILQREAGALTAVHRGAELIRSGAADRVIAGVVDHVSPLLHALLDRFEALARPDDHGDEMARPFDAARNGFLLAEGACVLVLERRSVAHERKARVYAAVQTGGGAFDATASRTGWGHGEAAIADAMTRTLERASVPLSEISHVVSGASGARAGDRLEASVLRRMWNDRALPPIITPKAFFGQYGGGLLAAAVLLMTGAELAPTPGFRTPDPALGVQPYAGGTLARARHALVTCMASGGAASWLVLEHA